VYTDGGIKASLYCILGDRWKSLIIVLVSKTNIKNTGRRASTVHKQLR